MLCYSIRVTFGLKRQGRTNEEKHEKKYFSAAIISDACNRMRIGTSFDGNYSDHFFEDI